MLDVLFGQLRGKLGEFRTAAKDRRRISANDLGADTLDYCAAEMELVLSMLEDASSWLSVEAFAEIKQVTPQTVRAWIRRGELKAETTARGAYRVQRGAERTKVKRRMPKRGPRRSPSSAALARAG